MTVINRNSASPVFDTVALAQLSNMRVGQICLVKNNTGSDGVAINYEIKATGSGGLVMSNGNELVALKANSVDSVADLESFSGTVAKQQINVGGYHPGSTVGGGVMVWGNGRHDGVIFFDPNRAFPDFGVPAEVTAWYADSGVNADCWVRVDSDEIDLHMAGAVGSTSVDSTEAVLKAFTVVLTTLIVPIGRFLVNAQINRTARIDLIGMGIDLTAGSFRASTLIKGASVAGDFITLNANASRVESVQFEGEAGNTGDGLVSSTARMHFSNVAIFGMGRDGLRLGTDTPGSNANLFKFENIRSKYNGRHGVHISQPSGSLWDANAGSFIDGDLQYNGECGIYLDYCAFNKFINLGCQANGTYGLYATDNSQAHTFLGGDFEVNGRGGTAVTSYYDFWLSNLSVGNRIIGITCFNFPQTLYIGSDQNTVLDANEGTFSGDQQYSGLMLQNIESDKPTVFDYYKEGDFTPTVVGATTAGTATYSTQTGRYSRIGRVVTFTINISWTGHTGTGAARIEGLPFPNGAQFSPVSITPAGISIPANTYLTAFVFSSASFISLLTANTDYLSTISSTTTNLALAATGGVRISGTYIL